MIKKKVGSEEGFNFSQSIHLEANEVSINASENQDFSLEKRLALVTGITDVLADVSEMSPMLEEIMGLVFKNISNCERGVILLKDWRSNAISTNDQLSLNFATINSELKAFPSLKPLLNTVLNSMNVCSLMMHQKSFKWQPVLSKIKFNP